ncbi:MAG: membrane lipoprotein lipid attachment site-containing protein [Candidatus Omnitrophica bacterium]|nr:membrane lipoprotein lipid attachment site-containing protein [Candidatus Omnitrophota bacterium]MDD5430014.1 membrane lipoprotein lipid attachment site-containing protein [Candidatus Omnitrophota bacterium]
MKEIICAFFLVLILAGCAQTGQQCLEEKNLSDMERQDEENVTEEPFY